MNNAHLGFFIFFLFDQNPCFGGALERTISSIWNDLFDSVEHWHYLYYKTAEKVHKRSVWDAPIELQRCFISSRLDISSRRSLLTWTRRFKLPSASWMIPKPQASKYICTKRRWRDTPDLSDILRFHTNTQRLLGSWSNLFIPRRC